MYLVSKFLWRSSDNGCSLSSIQPSLNERDLYGTAHSVNTVLGPKLSAIFGFSKTCQETNLDESKAMAFCGDFRGCRRGGLRKSPPAFDLDYGGRGYHDRGELLGEYEARLAFIPINIRIKKHVQN